MKRLKAMGLFLVVMMLCASLPVSAAMVLPEELGVDVTLPAKGNTIFTPDFSVDKTVSMTKGENGALQMVALSGAKEGDADFGVSEIAVENQKLVINRSAKSWDGFKMWLNSNESAIKDKVVAASFDVQRSDKNTGFEFRLTNSFNNGNESVGVALNANDVIAVRGQTKKINTGGKYASKIVTDTVNHSVRFTLMYNPIEEAGSAWVTYQDNGVEKTELLCSGAYPRVAGGVYGVYCYSEEGNPGKIEISNLTFYEAEPTELDKVNYAVNYAQDMLQGALGIITENTELPTSYKGVDLSYSTTDSCIAIENGFLVVKEARPDQNLPAALTVTASSGGVSVPVTLNLEVGVDKTVPVPVAPSKEDCLYYEDFEDSANVSGTYRIGGTADAANTLSIQNGKLTYHRTAAKGWDGLQLALPQTFGEDGTVVEFEAGRPTANTDTYYMPTFIDNQGVSPSNRLIWMQMRESGVYNYRSAGVTGDAGRLNNYTPSATHKFQFVHYFSKNTYDVYIDGKLAGSDIVTYQRQNKIQSIALMSDRAAANAKPQDLGDWTLDNVKIYKAATIWEDPISLTVPSVTLYDFELPQKSGINNISWESNSPVIAVEGNMARVHAQADKETDVTLTAYTYVNGVKIYKTFQVKVPMNETPPMVGEYIYNEDFSDPANVSGVIENLFGSTKAQIEDGRLKLSWVDGQTSVGLDMLNLFFTEDKKDITPQAGSRLALEFDIEMANQNKAICVSASQANERNARTVDLRVSGLLDAYNGPVNSGTRVAQGLPYKQKYMIVIDFDNGSYDLFVDGAKYVDGFLFRSGATVGQLQVYIESENTVWLDNVKAYSVGVSDKEKLDSDFAELEAAGFSAINTSPQDLVETAFSYTATLGTQVKFSSEKGLVNADGTINIPGHTTADKVSATLYFGDYEKSVTYDVVIAGESVVIEDAEASGWSGNDYYAVYTAYTLTGKDQPAVVAVAAYENGKLVKVELTDNVIGPKTGDINTDYIEGSLTLAEKTENTVVKAFVFKDLNNLEPIY